MSATSDGSGGNHTYALCRHGYWGAACEFQWVESERVWLTCAWTLVCAYMAALSVCVHNLWRARHASVRWARDVTAAHVSATACTLFSMLLWAIDPYGYSGTMPAAGVLVLRSVTDLSYAALVAILAKRWVQLRWTLEPHTMNDARRCTEVERLTTRISAVCGFIVLLTWLAVLVARLVFEAQQTDAETATASVELELTALVLTVLVQLAYISALATFSLHVGALCARPRIVRFMHEQKLASRVVTDMERATRVFVLSLAVQLAVCVIVRLHAPHNEAGALALFMLDAFGVYLPRIIFVATTLYVLSPERARLFVRSSTSTLVRMASCDACLEELRGTGAGGISPRGHASRSDGDSWKYGPPPRILKVRSLRAVGRQRPPLQSAPQPHVATAAVADSESVTDSGSIGSSNSSSGERSPRVEPGGTAPRGSHVELRRASHANLVELAVDVGRVQFADVGDVWPAAPDLVRAARVLDGPGGGVRHGGVHGNRSGTGGTGDADFELPTQCTNARK